jgi:ubiquinone/menaquinone biosynthesis C-methylase UbiE
VTAVLLPIPEKRTGPEFLDLPESYHPDELEGSLADIRVINRYLGDRRALLKHLSRQVGAAASFSLLDVATGSGDLLIDIARWAKKRGKTAILAGVDNNERTVAVATRETEPFPEITVAVADGLKLPFADDSFDFVICSKTAHHFDEADAVRLVQEMLRVARRGFLLMDLRRSWIAWFLIRVLSTLFTKNRLTRADGPLSVLKAFTPDELADLASKAGAARFTVTREPFYLLVVAGDAT